MDNGCRVGKPKEGLNTLVARFSFTHFDKAVEKIKLEFIGQQTMFIKDIGEKTYDLAIVGAGPAGITLALRLAEQTRATILLIESGARESKQEILKLSEVAATGDLASNYYPLHAQRVFGGTSTVWTGFCTTMEKRAFLNNEWPIEYEDISPYYPLCQ